MVKAKLKSITEKWIDGKTERQNTVKDSKQIDPTEKIKQTIYITREANKLLWQTRVDTGITISSTIDGLVKKHLVKK